MKELHKYFTFDIKQTTTVKIPAEDADQAISIIDDMIDNGEIFWINTEYINRSGDGEWE